MRKLKPIITHEKYSLGDITDKKKEKITQFEYMLKLLKNNGPTNKEIDK